MEDWTEFSTITSFDPGTTHDEICQSTKLIRNLDIISHNKSATTPVSLLVQSLVQQLCMLLEEDKQKAIHLYNTICEKLHEMDLLDESYTRGEFEDMRYQYQKALNNLVKVTHDIDLKVYPTAWRVQSVYTISRYYREFEEESFIAKGGFGKVFRVKNRLDDVHYAIKKVIIKAKDLDSISKHLCEVKTLAGLSHPNIVPYKSAWLEPLFNHTEVNDLDDNEESSQENSSSELYEGDSEYLSHSNKTDSKFEVCFENTNNKDDGSIKSIIPLKESRALCRLNSRDSLERYLDSTRVNLQWATLYIQMSLCDMTLKEWLEERNSHCTERSYKLNSPHIKKALEIFTQLIKAVHYIHDRGIIHHDIKPTNIFITIKNDTIDTKLADFGLACPLQRQHNGKTFGTPLYAAPEQIEGKCHAKSDLYSLGFILLELIEFFDTSMEKDKIFKLLRNRSLPTNVITNYPKIGKIIIKLTENDIDDRINTSHLLSLIKALSNNNFETILVLQEELAEKDVLINIKDKEISRLQELLKSNNISY